VRVRITRPWRLRDFPFASLGVGKIFEVRSSLAAYLFAMRCAEPAHRRRTAPLVHWTTRQRRKLLAGPWRRGATQSGRLWQFLNERSVAEARICIAGKWHRLRLELDAGLMEQCSFYVDVEMI
jgi:hypothetical protein